MIMVIESSCMMKRKEKKSKLLHFENYSKKKFHFPSTTRNTTIYSVRKKKNSIFSKVYKTTLYGYMANNNANNDYVTRKYKNFGETNK